jgi:predicted  nucleic acid-binding Zn-ribbon protein
MVSEKYLKKLVGNTEIDDALKRLDKLTQEESRVVTAQALKVTHAVDDRMRGVTDKVLSVDNRVADVDDRVAVIDDRVKAVDDKIAAVIDGAQYTSN